MKKILYIILDGLGDRPVKELGHKTPLEAAETPNMDFLAKNGANGLQNMLPEGVYPTSEECHLVLFGYDYIQDYPGRGVLEALGAGIALEGNDVAFRVDIGTVDDNLVLVDPHAGGVESVKELTNALKGIEIEGVKFEIYATIEHRGVLVMRDPEGKLSHRFSGHSTKVGDTDPHKSGPHAKNVKVLTPVPLDDSKEAQFAARILGEYQAKTFEMLKNHPFNISREKGGKLPCNFILTRGVGSLRNIKSFEDKYQLKAAAVAGAPLYKGIARYLDMDLHDVAGATGKTDTDLNDKVTEVINILTTNDQRLTTNFVYLHIKGTDSLAEDFGDYEGKKKFIEKIDKAFFPFMDLKDVIIMITGDHTTACEVKDHVLDPVPFLVYGLNETDEVSEFGETAAKNGAWGQMRGLEFFKKIRKSAEEE